MLVCMPCWMFESLLMFKLIMYINHSHHAHYGLDKFSQWSFYVFSETGLWYIEYRTNAIQLQCSKLQFTCQVVSLLYYSKVCYFNQSHFLIDLIDRFSQWTVFMCLVRLDFWLVLWEQRGHLNGFSPVWIRQCCFRIQASRKIFPQMQQVFLSTIPEVREITDCNLYYRGILGYIDYKGVL